MVRGPIPLPAHERQRRNLESRPSPPESGGTKPPPARGWNDWPAAARDWWRATRQLGQQLGYRPADWQIALRAARLIVAAEVALSNGEPGLARSLLTEVRQIEDRLLLSVRARRAARVELPDDRAGGGPAEVPDYRALVTEIGGD